MAPTATEINASAGAQSGDSHSPLPSSKRRRLSPKPASDDPYAVFDEEDGDDYESKRFVPLKQRKLLELQRISSKSALAAAKAAKIAAAAATSAPGSASPRSGVNTPKGADNGKEEEDEEEEAGPKRSTRALLDEARELREQQKYADRSEAEKLAEEERKILEAHAARKKLASANELAKGIAYTEPIKTSWRPPRFIRERSDEENEKLREQNHILVDGDDVPPPITNFTVSRKPSLRGG